MSETPSNRRFVIVGGGPAGLTAAYELVRENVRPVVLEKRDRVGGISRTENYKGFFFDMGGHRFFSKAESVRQMWNEVLGDDFLRRPRLSRIFYNQKFYYYPLKPVNALLNLGFLPATQAMLSYVRWQLRPYRQEETFEEWVTNRFGQRLFLTFFKTYTEKVWGISTSELKAEWAAQRIKDLDLKTAVLSMFFNPGSKIKTLIEEFNYPRRGPGMLWNAVKAKVEEGGGAVRLNSEVVRISRREDRIQSVTVRGAEGGEEVLECTDVISSMPVTELVKKLDPPAPPEVLAAASNLHYRDFLTVCLIVNNPHLFPDNWIYVHDPSVQVGRIQNFKNWSPEMVPDPNKSSLGLEYFCNEGDALWTKPDAELIEQAKREIAQVGLAKYEDVEDGTVFRVEKSYPVYDQDYRQYLDIVRGFLDRQPNLQTIGRNGLHRYNNQDHSMITGMLAVRNLLYGEHHNLWSVNGEQEYHEEVRVSPRDAAPRVDQVLQQAFTRVFEKLDPIPFGLALGMTLATIFFAATATLVLKGGANVGENLGLLGNFFPGYSVTWGGSLLGLVYGFLGGLIAGMSFAVLRNMALYLYVVLMERRFEFELLREVLDF